MTGNYFTVVAGVLFGPVAVGALRAAQQLLAPVQVVTLAATNVIPVEAARKLNADTCHHMNRYLLRVALIGGAASLLVGIILSVGGEFWLKLIFGPKFSGYAHLVPWFSGALVLMFWQVTLRAGLRALEDTRTLFWGYVVAAFVSLVIAYPLVRRFEIEGAAVGILMSHAICAAFQLWGLRSASRQRLTA